MFVLSLTAAWNAYADDAPRHSIALRYRQGQVPNAIMDNFYFDADELPAALQYGRPTIVTQVFGVDYTLGFNEDRAGVMFYAERLGVPMEEGFWDDREDPADHTDGQWFDPNNLGAWTAGANFVYNVPILTSVQGFEIKLGISAGLGVGVVTGQTDVWKAGNVEGAGDCENDRPAPERRDLCPADEQLAVPSVIPVLDVTVGPRFRILKRILVRGDFGFHDSLYWGVAAGVAI